MKVNMVGAVRSAVGQRAALAVKVVSYARNDSEGRISKKFAPPPICTTLCLQRLRSNLQELAHTWGCARFTTRKRQAFPCVRRSVCGIASAAVLAETCSAMWSIRRTSTFVMPSSFWPTNTISNCVMTSRTPRRSIPVRNVPACWKPTRPRRSFSSRS